MSQKSIRNQDAYLTFIGSFPSPNEKVDTNAFSYAGTQFQEGLIQGIEDAGIIITDILSLRPVSSYPLNRKLFFYKSHSYLLKKYHIYFLPFINYGPLKTISIVFSLILYLSKWSIKNRGKKRFIIQYNISNPPGIISIIMGLIANTKVFAVIADIQVPGSGEIKKTLFRQIEFYLQRIALPLFDGLIVLSKQCIKDYAPNTPFIQIDGAIDNQNNDKGDDSFQIPEKDRNSFIIMYSGDLSELRGISLLLGAFSLLQEKKHFRLWITGKGSLEKVVEKAVSNDSRITYWGFIDYKKVKTMQKCSDVLVNPHLMSKLSSKYLFPSKLIEYMYSGRPVISSLLPSMDPEYNKYIFTFHNDTPQELATLFLKVESVSKEKLDSIGKAAKEFINTKKNWTYQGGQVANFISNILR